MHKLETPSQSFILISALPLTLGFSSLGLKACRDTRRAAVSFSPSPLSSSLSTTPSVFQLLVCVLRSILVTSGFLRDDAVLCLVLSAGRVIPDFYAPQKCFSMDVN